MREVASWCYKAITIITVLVLGWILLIYLSQGLEICPTLLLFAIFLLLILIACLLYRQRYRKVLLWAKRRWPNMTATKALRVGLILALVLGLVARLSFLIIGNRFGLGEDSLSDNGIHWYYAPALVHGEEIQPAEGIYEAFFPHLMTYSATLAGFMKIFGTNYSAVLFSNIIFDLVTVVMVYLLLRQWRGQSAARLGAIIWLLNPLEILFCSCSLSIVVTNMWLAVALLLGYLALQALRQPHWWQTILIALGLGLTIGIGNAYRPIFTVLTIAFSLALIYQILYHGKTLIIPALVSLLLVVCSSMGCGKLIDLGHQAINPYAVPGGVGVGWNFFVGANYDTNGHWSRADSNILAPMLYGQPASETDVAAVQHRFMEMTIERYREMGIAKFLPHLLNKSIILFADDSETITWPVISGFQISGDHPAYLVAHSLGVIAFVACVLLTFIYCLRLFWQGRWHFDTYSLFLMLCICGLIAISLLVEVMRRYTMPLLVIFVILAAAQLAGKTAKSYQS